MRLWPGAVAVALLLPIRFVVPLLAPGFEGFRVAFAGAFFGTIAILLWWVAFSRAPSFDRWGALVAWVSVLALTLAIGDPSMGFMWCVFYGAPIASLTLVAWAATSRGLPAPPRRIGLLAVLAATTLPWSLVRNEGLTGDHVFVFAWRFGETREHALLANDDMPRNVAAARTSDASAVEWPGFRGARRDGIIAETRIATDWSESPPIELWRRPIGPGWSSFAVRGERAYTQEQRGEHELVSCYHTVSGEPLWRHEDTARFFESMGGAGPRATPAVHGARVYALGATGILNALDANSGDVVWTRDIGDDSGTDVPSWGFASSPLVVGDLLVVAAGGRPLAYDLETGAERWIGSDAGASYSSPHLAVLAGVEQAVVLSDAGARGVSLVDGSSLWEHAWAGVALVQPAFLPGGDVVISAGEGRGIRRISVARDGDRWTTETVWETNRLRPNFNDFVVRGDNAFGFDGSRLACVDLEGGRRVWKEGRFGHGQLVLLEAQGLLLVLSEHGELALVEASATGYSELGRSRGIEGKSWNHPVVVGSHLLIRNSEEMAAFRLPAERM